MSVTASALPAMTVTSLAQSGKNYKLYVAVSGTTATDYKFALIGGQRNSPLSIKSNTIDASHKSSDNWGETITGTKNWSISFNGLEVTDDDGVEAMRIAMDEDKPLFFKQIEPDGYYRTGWGRVSELSNDVPHDGVATLKATINGVGAISARTAPTGG